MTLSVSVLGRFDIRCGSGGRQASPKIPKKGGALLAYLACQEANRASRDRLADLLWSYQNSDQARHSLRNCVLELRKALAPATHVEGDNDYCWLEDVLADVGPFGDADESIEGHKQAATLYRGQLLDDFPRIDSEPWNEWLEAERERFAVLLQAHLFTLAKLSSVAGDHHTAVAAARRVVALDPLCEPSSRLLMHVLAAADRKAEAVRHYDICAATLRRELGVGPSAMTRALLDKIRVAAPVDQAVKTARAIDEAMVEIERLQAENRELKARNLRLEAVITEAREVAEAA